VTTDPRLVRGCTGKTAFATWAQADERARRMRQNHEDGCYVEPYRCKHCGRFHVGQRFDGARAPARTRGSGAEDSR
jgi:hypothetical protein